MPIENYTFGDFPVPNEIVDELSPIFKAEIIVERFLNDAECSSDDGEYSVWEPVGVDKKKPAMAKNATQVQSSTLDKYLIKHKVQIKTKAEEPSPIHSFRAGHVISEDSDDDDSGEVRGANNSQSNTSSLLASTNNNADNPWMGQEWYQKLKATFKRNCLDNILFDQEGHGNLFAEDLNEEDDMYVLQCPKEMDPKLLVGEKLNLHGEDQITIHSEKGVDCYQSYCDTEFGSKCINIILPSRENRKFKLVSRPLAGSIVMVEGLGIPKIEHECEPEPENFPLPEIVVKRLRKSFSESSFMDSSMAENIKDIKKHERLRDSRDENDWDSIVTVKNEVDWSFENKEPKKECESFDTVDVTSCPDESFTNCKKKKKKNRHSEDRKQETEISVQPQLCTSDISSIPDCTSTEKKKKKKKDKHKEAEPSEELFITDISAIQETCSIKGKENKNRDISYIQESNVKKKTIKESSDDNSDISLSHNMIHDYSQTEKEEKLPVNETRMKENLIEEIMRSLMTDVEMPSRNQSVSESKKKKKKQKRERGDETRRHSDVSLHKSKKIKQEMNWD